MTDPVRYNMQTYVVDDLPLPFMMKPPLQVVAAVDYDGLAQAAQAVIDRWDSPLWKDLPATAGYINALRQTLGTHGYLDDGFGNRWRKCSATCGMQIVRPGKIQCECDRTSHADVESQL